MGLRAMQRLMIGLLVVGLLAVRLLAIRLLAIRLLAIRLLAIGRRGAMSAPWHDGPWRVERGVPK